MSPEEARIRARVLELERERSKKTPGVMENVASEFMTGMRQGGPPAAMIRAGMAGIPSLAEWENEQITQGAYKVGGMATDLAAKTGVPPEVAGGVGVAANMATQAIPMVVGGEVSNILMSPTFQWAGKKVMGSALKPTSGERMSGKADKVIQTMFDEGKFVTRGSVEKMERIIPEINKRIEAVIASSRSTVDKQKIVAGLEAVKKRYQFRPDRELAEAELDVVRKTFEGHPEVSGLFRQRSLRPDQIPVQTAQKLKQGYQGTVGDKGYGPGVKTATTRGEIAVARALREGLEKAEPVVGPLNAREKGLIDAVKMVKRRAGMEENNNLLGIAPIAHNPTAFVAMLADKWGLTKSVVAHILYGAPRPAGQAVGAVAGGLREDD